MTRPSTAPVADLTSELQMVALTADQGAIYIHPSESDDDTLRVTFEQQDDGEWSDKWTAEVDRPSFLAALAHWYGDPSKQATPSWTVRLCSACGAQIVAEPRGEDDGLEEFCPNESDHGPYNTATTVSVRPA